MSDFIPVILQNAPYILLREADIIWLLMLRLAVSELSGNLPLAIIVFHLVINKGFIGIMFNLP